MFKDEGERLKSNSSKMTGTSEVPVEVQDDGESATVVIGEESDEEQGALNLADIPAARDTEEESGDGGRGEKRRRRSSDALFVSDDPQDGGVGGQQPTPLPKRKKATGEHDAAGSRTDRAEDSKKKMGLDTSYDGFSIYGRILCLVVRRKGAVRGKPIASTGAGQAMMEEWIASTQVERAEEE